MRRSTLLTIGATALVLILAGQWPAVVGDSGWKQAASAVTQGLAWRPSPRIAPPPAVAPPPRQRPQGWAPETVAAVSVGAAVAALFALGAVLSWLTRPAPARRRQPRDAARWLARDAHAAH